jgi:hypothetical protein
MRDCRRFWRKLAQLLAYALALTGCTRSTTQGWDGGRPLTIAAGSGSPGSAATNTSASTNATAGTWPVEIPPTLDAGHADPRDPRTGSCGDGIVNGGEYCDGDALNATCLSLGFAGGGQLLCNPICLVDTTNCRMTASYDGSRKPPILDDSGLSTCVPNGACMDDNRRICAEDATSCKGCSRDAECQFAYDDPLVHCVESVCKLRGL